MTKLRGIFRPRRTPAPSGQTIPPDVYWALIDSAMRAFIHVDALRRDPSTPSAVVDALEAELDQHVRVIKQHAPTTRKLT
jgi:hypothetical protein